MTGRDLFVALTRALGVYFLFIGLSGIPSVVLWFAEWGRETRELMQVSLIQSIGHSVMYVLLGAVGFFAAGWLAGIAYGEQSND